MKKIILFLLLSNVAFGQIKVKDLPTTTTGSTNDYLLKDDAAGTPGSTKKISIASFIDAYTLTQSGITSTTPMTKRFGRL